MRWLTWMSGLDDSRPLAELIGSAKIRRLRRALATNGEQRIRDREAKGPRTGWHHHREHQMSTRVRLIKVAHHLHSVSEIPGPSAVSHAEKHDEKRRVVAN